MFRALQADDLSTLVQYIDKYVTGAPISVRILTPEPVTLDVPFLLVYRLSYTHWFAFLTRKKPTRCAEARRGWAYGPKIVFFLKLCQHSP